MNRAKADYNKYNNSYDNCEGFCEECIISNTFPHFCPINDNPTAVCMHLKRSDNVPKSI